MSEDVPFSERHGYVTPEPPITIRDSAPDKLRTNLIKFAQKAGLADDEILDLVSGNLPKYKYRSRGATVKRILNRRIDELDEAMLIINSSLWFSVYDCAEHFSRWLSEIGSGEKLFAMEVNRYFREMGVGWQLINGRIETRFPDALETTVRGAVDKLQKTGKTTASTELHEALRGLSRRPSPDLSGAIQHARAALECIVVDAAGKPKVNFNKVLKTRLDLLPAPLDDVANKIYGFASDKGVHLLNKTPTFEQAQLVVGLTAVLTTYIVSSRR